MAKYDPLRTFLQRQRGDVVELSFREIENLIGYMLPKAAGTEGWWTATGPVSPKGVQYAAWRSAGFEAAKIADERVMFRRCP